MFDYESLALPVISFRCSTAISIPAGDFDSVFDCDSLSDYEPARLGSRARFRFRR